MRVETFLRVDGEFISISECHQAVRNEYYIEGAIEITIQKNKILSREHWDYVDQLWSYLLKGISAISEGHSFSTYLPDQPVEVSFKLLDTDKVEVQVQDNKTSTASVVQRNLFLKVMLEACRDFFLQLPKVAPGTIDLCKQTLVRIEEIQKRISFNYGYYKYNSLGKWGMERI
ncbi:hypothetical protein KA005_48360 [bacterium]|nr:hypothetical protein [bacterium]